MGVQIPPPLPVLSQRTQRLGGIVHMEHHILEPLPDPERRVLERVHILVEEPEYAPREYQGRPKGAKDRIPGLRRFHMADRPLTEKQQRLLEALPESSTLGEAAAKAGYPSRRPAVRALAKVKKSCGELLDAIGWGREAALAALAEMADAQKVVYWAKDGIVTDERVVADNDARLKARIEINKILGHYQQDGNRTDDRSAAVAVRVVISDEGRAARLAELFAAGSSAGVAVDVAARVDEDLG